MTYRFTATLNRKQGASIFKGTAEGCRDMADGFYVVSQLLKSSLAFEKPVTSMKITISPSRKKA